MDSRLRMRCELFLVRRGREEEWGGGEEEEEEEEEGKKAAQLTASSQSRLVEDGRMEGWKDGRNDGAGWICSPDWDDGKMASPKMYSRYARGNCIHAPSFFSTAFSFFRPTLLRAADEDGWMDGCIANPPPPPPPWRGRVCGRWMEYHHRPFHPRNPRRKQRLTEGQNPPPAARMCSLQEICAQKSLPSRGRWCDWCVVFLSADGEPRSYETSAAAAARII